MAANHPNITGEMTHRGHCNRCGVAVGFVPFDDDENPVVMARATVIWARVAFDLPPLPRLIMWECPACDWQN